MTNAKRVWRNGDRSFFVDISSSILQSWHTYTKPLHQIRIENFDAVTDCKYRLPRPACMSRNMLTIATVVTSWLVKTYITKNYLVFWYSLYWYQCKSTFPKESFWQTWKAKECVIRCINFEFSTRYLKIFTIVSLLRSLFWGMNPKIRTDQVFTMVTREFTKQHSGNCFSHVS